MMANERHEPGSSAVQAHLRNTQSTHSKAAEASAARLLILLRQAYPSQGEKSIAAQGSLVAYLQAKIAGRDEDFSAILDNPQIKNTIRLIDAISAAPKLSTADKIKIWKQMESIAKTCPGLSWDGNHARWSTNHVYNPSTKANDSVIASPAETMNLVCAAIFDTNRYATDNEADLRLRIESFYKRLLDLQTQEEARQFEFCAAGRQHDMLFLLNMSYLDKPRDEAGASPIQLIGDTGTFLLDSLSSYIESELSAVSAEIRGHVVLDSMRSQSNLIQIDEYPLITWLHEKHEGGWKAHCMDYLEKRCMAFGIDPRQCQLDAYIEQLESLPLPAMGEMLEPMMAEIFSATPFPVRAADAGGVGVRIDDWTELALAANAALEIIKHNISPEIYEHGGQLIRDFYKALKVMKSLNHYKHLRVFIGAEEGAFNQARDDLQRALLPYFRDFNLERRLAPEVEGPLQRYLTQEKAFNQRSQVDYVENSFAALFAGENLDAWLNRLHALKPAGADKHPLELSDDVLESWYSKYVVPGAEGELPTMDVSPYQINRILLHALLVAPNQWTPTYAESLRLVTEWLLQPKKPGEGLLNTLKDSYPGVMLSNLLLQSLLNRQSFRQDAVRRRLNALFENKQAFFNQDFLQTLIQENTMGETTDTLAAIQGRLVNLIQDGDQLIRLLSLPDYRLNAGHRNQILAAVQGHLVDWFQNRYVLANLLSLPESKLNAEHRTLILTDIQGRLVNLIQDGDQLIRLLSLPDSQLNAGHRNQILAAVQGQLVDLIQNPYQLRNLLSLHESQLNAEHRTQILTDIQGRLVNLIQDGDQLIRLLSLPESQLNAEHRTRIWAAVQGHLVDWFQNRFVLTDLLSLPESKLNAEHRTLIWAEVQGRLVDLIKNGDQLWTLLSLPESQLNAEHVTQIWDAVQGRLVDWIQDGYQLKNLLSLPESQLNVEHRTRIWAAVQGRLVDLIQNPYQLRNLLSLPEPQLNAERRTQIWAAVQGRLVDWIKNGDQLSALLSLPESQLNAEYRTQIWAAVQGRLVDLIQNPYQLMDLLSLPESQLNAEHRTQILTAIEGRLVDWIKDKYQLMDLLSLPESQLNAEYRTKILTAIEGRLVDWIKDKYQLMDLLSLPESQLNAEHRTQILTAIEGRLVDWIKNGYELTNLLLRPESQLNTAHRTQILTAIEGRLVDLIQDKDQLIRLLSLSESQLNAEHRTRIFTAIQDRLVNLIQDGDQLRDLLSLPESTLNAVHKIQILRAIEGRLVDWIKNGSQLKNLLSLSESQLNGEHRTLIWRALKGRLLVLIQEGVGNKGIQLISLLYNAQLNAEHRALILRNVFECLSIFSLDPNQRRVILDLIFPDRPIPIEHFIELLKVTPSDVGTLSREMSVTKEDVVAYIRGLNDRDKVILIKQIFDERYGAGLHAFFAIQRGYTPAAENKGMFKELAEMIVPSLRQLGFFARTAQAYHDAVLAVPDPELDRGGSSPES